MLELGRVSRSSFYRFDPEGQPGTDRDMELRDAIQRIALEMPSYGRPRITAELRRRGWTVNPKRVYRLLREDNLLCVRRRKFVVTTDSNHERKIYPNLARALMRIVGEPGKRRASGLCLNGKDVDPHQAMVSTLACRLYANRTGVPSDEVLRTAVSEAKRKER
jgi:hypothetical protein